MLVRVHSECLTGDVFGSRRCDCGPQLHLAMQKVQAAGRGVVLYISQEGRGIGLANKIKAYALQAEGADTVDANRMLGLPDDARKYDAAAAMLALHEAAAWRPPSLPVTGADLLARGVPSGPGLGRLLAHGRIAPGTQAPGELPADVDLGLGVAHQQRLGVRVDGDELHAGHVRHHVIDDRQRERFLRRRHGEFLQQDLGLGGAAGVAAQAGDVVEADEVDALFAELDRQDGLTS